MTEKRSRVLVLGATGMLGNAMLRLFARGDGQETWGSARSPTALQQLPTELRKQVIVGVDVENFDSLTRLFAYVQPDVVVNCVGLVKQIAEADDPLQAIPINALLPHRLARLCQVAGARLLGCLTDLTRHIRITDVTSIAEETIYTVFGPAR